MGWKLAELDDKQLAIVNEAEGSMHMDYLLVYAQAESDPSLDLCLFYTNPGTLVINVDRIGIRIH